MGFNRTCPHLQFAGTRNIPFEAASPNFWNKEWVNNNLNISHPIFERFSIVTAQNRTTIPALLLNQIVQIQTKSERDMPKLLLNHS